MVWMLAYLLLIAIWIVPTTSMWAMATIFPQVSVNLYYLNPALAIFKSRSLFSSWSSKRVASELQGCGDGKP